MEITTGSTFEETDRLGTCLLYTSLPAIFRKTGSGQLFAKGGADETVESTYFSNCVRAGDRERFSVYRLFDAVSYTHLSVLVLSIANLNAKLVRLGTEYARFTENLLYVEDFLNFFAEEKPAQKRCV